MTWQPLIQPALDLIDTHSIEDVETLIADGEAMLWLGEKSAAVTEILIFPKAKVFNIWLCGGDMDELLEHMLPRAIDRAIAEGCTRMRSGGRKGWDRVLAKHGFAPLASICEKDLRSCR